MALTSGLSLEAFQYAACHVFLCPQLRQEEDFDPSHEHELLCFVLSAMEKFQVFRQPTVDFQHAANMVRIMISSRPGAFLDPVQVGNAFKNLPEGEYIAFELRGQNFGVLVHRGQDIIRFEQFELLARNEDVMNCKGRLLRRFPVELDHTTHPTCRPMVAKGGKEQIEERDTINPRLIALLTGLLRGLGRQGCSTPIMKHSREEVLWRASRVSWHRSASWIFLRICLQLVLDRGREAVQACLYKEFMAFLMSELLQHALSMDIPDHLVYCMVAKVNRRFLKLSSSLTCRPDWLAVSSMAVEQAGSKLATRWTTIQDADKRAVDLEALKNLRFHEDTALKLVKLKPYLDWISDSSRNLERIDGTNSESGFPFTRAEPYGLPNFDPLRVGGLAEHIQCYSLADFENWVTENLQGWLLAHIDRSNTCEDLARLIDDYYTVAKLRYENNPVNMSIMWITIMELWAACDKSVINLYPLLKDHRVGLPEGFLEPLLLPVKSQMTRLRELEIYLAVRHDVARRDFPSAFEGFGDENSFAARFYETSKQHQELHQQILRSAERARAAKLEELRCQKGVYDDLKCRHDSVEHQVVGRDIRAGTWTQECSWDCSKCRLGQEMNDMRIFIHEWPLPQKEVHAKVVVFELQVPSAIVAWRRATMALMVDMLKDPKDPKDSPISTHCGDSYWALEFPDLNPYAWPPHTRRLQLASATKPFIRAHYRNIAVAEASEYSICKNHGSQYDYYDFRHELPVSEVIDKPVVPQECSFAHLSNSVVRQWIGDYSYTSNEVVARQALCPKEWALDEFKAFGHLRSGVRLQVRNILTQLMIPSLDLNKSDTACLISQAIYQAGPTKDCVDSIYRDAHEVFKREPFSLALVKALLTALCRVEENWECDIALLSLTTLCTRLLSLSTSAQAHQECFDILARVRSISQRWVHELLDRKKESDSEPERNDLNLRILGIALICARTFDVEPVHFGSILSVDEAGSCFIEASIIINNHILKKSPLPPLMLISLQSWRRLSYQALPSVSAKINNSRHVLDKAITTFWAAYTPGTPWSPMEQDRDHILKSQSATTTESNGLPVSFNLLDGSLLVDGRPLSRLPKEFQDHPTYARLFGTQILEIVPSELPSMDFSAARKQKGWIVHFAMIGVGLKSQLVLRSEDTESAAMRAVLVPHGTVTSTGGSIGHPVTIVRLTTDAAWTDSGYPVVIPRRRHHCFYVDSTLGRLVENGSLQSKLLLCHIHAATSRCLPDELTGRTGTEEALRILKSAAVVSFERLENEDIRLLSDVARLSPRRRFYPPHLRVMQTVDWADSLDPMAQSDEFSRVVRSILKHGANCEMFFPDDAKKIPELNVTDVHLQDRALVRCSTFRVSGFGAEEHTASFDTLYNGRDTISGSILQLEQYVCQLTKILLAEEQVMLEHVSDALLDRLYKVMGNRILGPTSQSTTKAYRFNSKWLDQPDISIGEDWCQIVKYLSCVNLAESKYDLMTFFGALVFSRNADVQVVQALLAFATVSTLRVLQQPNHPEFDLDAGHFYVKHALEARMDEHQWDITSTPEGSLSRYTNEPYHKFWGRCQSAWESKVSRIRSDVFSQLERQWPTSCPSNPNVDEFNRYFDVASVMVKVRGHFASWERNLQLRQHLQTAIWIMTRLQVASAGVPQYAAPGDELDLLTSRPNLAFVPIARLIANGPPTIICEGPPSFDDYYSYVTEDIPVGAGNDGKERLLHLLSSLRARASLVHEREYVDELEKSFRSSQINPDADKTAQFVHDDVEAGQFATLRILKEPAGNLLLKRVARALCEKGVHGLPIAHQNPGIRQAVLDYILDERPTNDAFIVQNDEKGFFCRATRGILLLVRGLFAGGILKFALSQKRWRVNYGLAERKPPKLVAVPYRAKDNPAPRAEFSHPDIVIVLTCLSYYYGGLCDAQLFTSFEYLQRSDQADEEFANWVKESAELPTASQLTGINLKDREKCIKEIFPALRFTKAVIDFYLDKVVFPREMVEFPKKLSASGWDLAKTKSHPVTGFSGTCDSKYILPLGIQHLDLPDQIHTNAMVLNRLLRSENLVRELGPNLSSESLLQSVVHAEPPIQVILDVGAQIVELDNEQAARLWLRLSPTHDKQAVIFVNDQDELLVLNRGGFVEPFLTSPFVGDTKNCLVFLDEAHTRGIDLKLPDDYRAGVILGPTLTKDRLVQACMRMRKLGKGQSITFFIPQEIQERIRNCASLGTNAPLTVTSVLLWSISETWTDTGKSIPLWAMQGIRNLRQEVIWNNKIAHESKLTLESSDLRGYFEDDAMSLEQRYLPSRQTPGHAFSNIAADDELTERKEVDIIGARCERYQIASFSSATLSEEQERELAPEMERERQAERPNPMKPKQHILHPDVLELVRRGNLNLNGGGFLAAFESFNRSTARRLANTLEFGQDLLVTTDFAKAVDLTAESHSDAFHRSVQWVLSFKNGTVGSQSLVILSSWEANELVLEIDKSIHVHLHSYAARRNLSFPTLKDLKLCTTPSIPPDWTPPPKSLILQLNIFAGQLYFEDMTEYKETCALLGLSCVPNDGSATVRVDGFVGQGTLYPRCRFTQSPTAFLRVVMSKIRRDCQDISRTHVGRMLAGEILTESDFHTNAG
ncbi:hypothetical protein DL764_006299 [Monosporascus ibericus]|uniref:ubiquitinyl hydrolase 1 n=1 Tax=Monosporascus ibericus TaxID=155417 RepID=A0A4Q4T548_9PEZI|nr:hypothetical protein DL764_006299 [Monosporascus ibericus]